MFVIHFYEMACGTTQLVFCISRNFCSEEYNSGILGYGCDHELMKKHGWKKK